MLPMPSSGDFSPEHDSWDDYDDRIENFGSTEETINSDDHQVPVQAATTTKMAVRTRSIGDENERSRSAN